MIKNLRSVTHIRVLREQKSLSWNGWHAFASLKLKSFAVNKQRVNITILFVLQTPPRPFPL